MPERASVIYQRRRAKIIEIKEGEGGDRLTNADIARKVKCDWSTVANVLKKRRQEMEAAVEEEVHGAEEEALEPLEPEAMEVEEEEQQHQQSII